MFEPLLWQKKAALTCYVKRRSSTCRVAGPCDLCEEIRYLQSSWSMWLTCYVRRRSNTCWVAGPCDLSVMWRGDPVLAEWLVCVTYVLCEEEIQYLQSGWSMWLTCYVKRRSSTSRVVGPCDLRVMWRGDPVLAEWLVRVTYVLCEEEIQYLQSGWSMSSRISSWLLSHRQLCSEYR